MRDSDLSGFTVVMKQLAAVFRRRPDTPEFLALTGSYFRALNRHELSELQRAADQWVSTEAKFPTPYELRRAIPRPAADLRTMSLDEARDYRAAEDAGYEGELCGCQRCVEAGVNNRPLRFVPEADVFDRDTTVNDPIRKRVVTAGHWAHGRELLGYYIAKDAFWKKTTISLTSLSPEDRRTRRHVSELSPLVSREPGQEG